MYGLRLQIEYKDINDIDSRIEVEQLDYIGAVTYREYADGAVAAEITSGDKSTKKLPLVYGSSITLYFDAELDYEFRDFFTANSRKNRIKYYKNNQLKLITYGEADTWTESLRAAPYEVSFTGYDGLGLLKETDFLQADKSYYEGTLSVLEILQLILNKTGFELSLNVADSRRPAGQLTEVDALTQYNKDLVVFRDYNCYEVLEELFRGCRIFQRDGQWFCLSNDQFEKSSITCFSYNADGSSNGTIVIDPRFGNFWFEGEGNNDFLPAIKQLVVKQDYGFKSNLINNGNFTFLSNGSLDGWTALGTTVETRLFDDDGNKYILLRGHEDISDSSWDTDQLNKYFKSDAIQVYPTTSIPTISLSYALMGSGGIAHMYFNAELLGDDGNRYTLKAFVDENDGNKLVYKWITTNTRTGAPLSADPKHKNPLFGSDYWIIDRKAVEAKPYDEVPDHFKSISVQIKEGIPVAGQFSIYLFLADTADSRIAGACYKDVGLKFADENDEELPTDITLLLDADQGNNYVPKDVSLHVGDLPDLPNKLTIYQGGFILNDGTATTAWQLDGTAFSYDYAEFIARFLASESKLAREMYKVNIANITPSSAMVFVDANNSNKLFLECGITYNDRMQTIEGRYVEIKPVDLDSFSVNPTINYIKSKSSGSSSAPKFTDTDEKVGLMTALFERTGPAGYLVDDDFFEEIDPVTARVLIKPRYLRIYHEQPTGTINGTNKDFTILYVPRTGTEVVIKNGRWMTPGIDYTIVDKVITFTAAPRAGTNYTDIIRVNYEYDQTQ